MRPLANFTRWLTQARKNGQVRSPPTEVLAAWLERRSRSWPPSGLGTNNNMEHRLLRPRTEGGPFDSPCPFLPISLLCLDITTHPHDPPFCRGSIRPRSHSFKAAPHYSASVAQATFAAHDSWGVAPPSHERLTLVHPQPKGDLRARLDKYRRCPAQDRAK